MTIQKLIEDKPFNQKGYIEVSGLLSFDAISRLLAYHQSENRNNDSDFYSSIWENDEIKRKKDFEAIEEIAWSEISKKFADYQLIMANFMIKKNGSQSSLGLHQDWTFVDENQNRATNIWIPLMDINGNNGPLNFILGSHKIDNPVRGKNIQQMFERGIPFLEKNYNKYFLKKKGDALIFDTRMIHYSPPNTSNHVRVAISMVIVPKNTHLIHYYKTEKASPFIHKIQVDYTYFYKYHLSDIPDSFKIIETFKENKINKWRQIKAIFQIIWFNTFNKAGI